MGSCFSKKNVSPPTLPSQVATSAARYAAATKAQVVLADTRLKMLSLSAKEEPKLAEEAHVKKETFVIKHRKSHDERERQQQKAKDAPIAAANCKDEVISVDENKKAKEEVDAILIQCGRLSRSSSGKAASSSNKYSGSKRSYDFDNGENDYQVNATTSDDASGKKNDDVSDERTRQRHRQSPRHSPSPGRRRRTPSRERTQQNQQQRSSSKERRTSRSPGRRLSMEQNNPNSTNSANTAAASAATANVSLDASGTNRPGKMKMISVPAAVMDKNSNGESATATAGSIKRISVKRNAGTASPRSQSPARGGANVKTASNESGMPPSLSRTSSRKAEQSPYRRNPLSELDQNAAHISNANNNSSSSNVLNQLKSNVEITTNKVITQGIKSNISPMEHKVVVEPSHVDGLKHQRATRSRSARRSRDLDNLNPERVSNPAPPSYTSLLLEDIQNFHQQGSSSTNAAPAAVSLPQCVSKAHSILEAVADLNSTSICSMKSNVVKHVPFVESEVLVGDDLMAPSFHKYVTVRRGTADMEDQESSGSNSLESGSLHPQWGLSSSSADSTDFWTSKSSTREADQAFDMDEVAARKRLSSSRRKTDGQSSAQSSIVIGCYSTKV